MKLHLEVLLERDFDSSEIKNIWITSDTNVLKICFGRAEERYDNYNDGAIELGINNNRLFDWQDFVYDEVERQKEKDKDFIAFISSYDTYEY